MKKDYIFLRRFIFVQHRLARLARVRGLLEMVREAIENDEIELAIRIAREAKFKYNDLARRDWWYRQWHSVFESVEFDLNRGLVEEAYRVLEQAIFHASVITSPSFSRTSVRQRRA